MRAVPDQISRWVPRPWTSLGTDGFGRSDTREALRRFFEIDAGNVVVATLAALAEAGDVETSAVLKAAADHGIDRDVEPSWVR
jgi:pyruvate dehydrogenase E1 component